MKSNLIGKRHLLFFRWETFATLIVITLTAGAKVSIADISVISNSANKATLDADQIKDIFLGKKMRFSDGSVAKPVDLSESSTTRKEFYLKLAKMDETAMKVYWSTLIFTGSAIPPKALNNDDEVVSYVKNNVEALGYIESGKSVDSSINVIFVIK